MIRPTPRLLALAAAAPPVATALILIDERLWMLATLLLVGLGVAAVVDARLGLRPSRLSIKAAPPSTLSVGLRRRGGPEGEIIRRAGAEPEILTLDIAAEAGAADPKIDGRLDVGPRLEPLSDFSFRLGPERRRRLEIPLTPLRRGEAQIERLWLRWPGPLGLSWRGRIETLEISVPAMPDLSGVRRAALALDRRSALFGLKPQTTGGDGAEFDALRDYHPGMDRRGVDWKRTAKHRKLLVKEFQAERNHNVVLALDSGHLMREPLQGAPKLDHAINAALTLGYQALVEGDRVGAFGFDAQVRFYHPPRPGKNAFPAVQKALSSLDYALEETNFTLGLTRLATALDRRSIIILITDFLDTVSAELMVDTLGHLSSRHLVLFAALKDPSLDALAFGAPADADELARAVTAAEIIRERRAVLTRLKRLGVDAIDVEPAELDAMMINRFLRAKRTVDPVAA
ncbi:MAG: DUF58 domain-containing protein [Pseudomonadota bacterium]